MTSRERVTASLNHQQPDGLAIDFGAMRSTGIHVAAYVKLVKALGLQLPPPKVYDVFQQLALPQDEVVARLGGDVVQAHQREPAFGISIEAWREDALPDGTPILVPDGYRPEKQADGSELIHAGGKAVAARPKTGLYFDSIVHPYQYAESVADVEAVPVAPMPQKDIDYLAQQVRHLYETTDKAILLAFGGNIFEAGQMDFGYEEFFVNLLSEPDMMHRYFERITDVYTENLKNLMPKIAPYAPVIQFGDDLGTQINAQISADTYRTMIKPYHQRQYRYVRENYPQCKVFLHSCGAIASLIPDLIDAGVEVLNPVQLSASGMDPRMLKREYGKHLTFWGGGANTPVTMTHGTPEQNARETRELIDIFSPGGGFVFTQVHNIQPNVPPENIIAVYDTALGYR